MKSVCLINNQCDPQSKIDTLNGQKVNITLSKVVEDNEDANDDIVEVKSVKYRELITKSQDDSIKDGRQVRLHHLMVIKSPPNIHENNMDMDESTNDDVKNDDANEADVNPKPDAIDDDKLAYWSKMFFNVPTTDVEEELPVFLA